MGRADFVAWLRNIDRKPWSLCVPYEAAPGDWHPLYPDFLVVREEGGGLVIDLLDPHMLDLADSVPKAVGLARFAGDHAHQFGRIELIVVEGKDIMRLDLSKERVRNKVKKVTTVEQLQQLFDSA